MYYFHFFIMFIYNKNNKMATIKDYVFDKMTRIGNDTCGLSQMNVQNINAGNYMVQNFFSSDCTMARPIEFATSQPGIFYEGGHQTGAGGCNIDINSKLLNGSIGTHPRCKISLNERPFITVPYLGRGECNPLLESKLIQGDMTINKRSVNLLSEQCYSSYLNYPLIPSIASTVTNPSNLVEGVASDGWVRGGIPSREMSREKAYASCNYNSQGQN
jgi:hypothetical protein